MINGKRGHANIYFYEQKLCYTFMYVKVKLMYGLNIFAIVFKGLYFTD